jgi:tetratricopeptide (TPR) repeat protein
MVASAYASARYELVAPLSQRLTALEAELAAPEPATRAWIDNARSWEAMYAGDAGRCLEIDRRVVDSFAAVGDLRNACLQRASVAYDMLVLGADRDAEIALREIIVTAERMGLKVVVAMAKHNLGLALARLGQLDEARRLENEAVARLEEQANWRLAGAARAYLAQILLLAGDAEGARLEAMRSAEVLRVAPPAKVQALATLGEALLALGRSGEALAAAREARQLMDELGEIEEGEAHARLVFAEALAAVGDPAAKPELAAARASLLARADKIGDAAWRESFLYRVPENARTLRLAEEWGLGASSVTRTAIR